MTYDEIYRMYSNEDFQCDTYGKPLKDEGELDIPVKGHIRINCVRKDSNGVITNVGIIDSGIYPIVTVGNHIHQHPQDLFYTIKYGNTAKVYARQHHVSK